MKEIGNENKNINDNIAILVKNGVAEHIQKALDVIRLFGNFSLHDPDFIVEDNIDIKTIFTFINVISNNYITEIKIINKTFDELPEDKKKEIEKRNIKSKKQ